MKRKPVIGLNADYRSQFIEQANHDGLTGLLNKRYFMQKLPPLVFQADREARPMALFLFDIDHFKHYNDTNGHPAGDELLRNLAALLKATYAPETGAAATAEKSSSSPCRTPTVPPRCRLPSGFGRRSRTTASKIRKPNRPRT